MCTEVSTDLQSRFGFLFSCKCLHHHHHHHFLYWKLTKHI